MIKLYKIDSLNRVCFWSIEIVPFGNLFDVKIFWGPLDGKPLEASITFPDKEQAEAEVRSRISTQKNRRGYTETIPKAPPTLPMLAQTFDPDIEYDFESFHIQPKLDGFRCIGSSVQLLSRRDTRITSCPNIEAVLNALATGVKLDGELYIHGVAFDILSGYIKRDTPCTFHHLIEYHVYDLVNTDMNYQLRYRTLEQYIMPSIELEWKRLRESVVSLPEKCPVKLVPTHYIGTPIELNIDRIKDLHQHYTSLGYEGVMLKNTEGTYEINKRSKNLLKVKDFSDHEFQIVDVEEGRGSSAGQAIFVCKTEDGSIFRCNPAFTRDAKRRVWQYRENYKGRWLKVKFQGWTSIPNRVPRQPIGLEVINNKDDQK